MPEIRIRAAAMLGMTANLPDGLLEIRFRTPANDGYCIEIPEGILGGLIVALTSGSARIRGTGPTQPMTLDSIRLFRYPDGEVGLELSLENAIRLPIVLSKETISTLRDAANALERLSTQSPEPPRRQ
jgi:hypothetical protein